MIKSIWNLDLKSIIRIFFIFFCINTNVTWVGFLMLFFWNEALMFATDMAFKMADKAWKKILKPKYQISDLDLCANPRAAVLEAKSKAS